MLRVVSGALIRDGYVLMGLRKKDGYRPDLWELPGGKIDPGESPAQALAREWKEECGVDVTVGDFISMAMLHLDISFVIELYAIALTNPKRPCAEMCDHDPCSCGALDSYTPCSLDHQELRWVNPLYAVQRMPCSPAFYWHYPQLVKHIEASWPMSTCDVVSDSGCTNETCSRCHPLARPVLHVGEL